MIKNISRSLTDLLGSEYMQAVISVATEIYGLERGKLAKGYFADLVIFDKDKEFEVLAEDQYSKCGWSPYEGETLKGFIEEIIINGKQINL